MDSKTTSLIDNIKALAEYQCRLGKSGDPSKDGKLFEKILFLQDAFLESLGLPSTPEYINLIRFESIPTDFELQNRLKKIHSVAQSYLLSDTESDVQILRKAINTKTDPFHILPELKIGTHVYAIFVYKEILLKEKDSVEAVLSNLKKTDQSGLLDALGKVYFGNEKNHYQLVQLLRNANIAYLDQFLKLNKNQNIATPISLTNQIANIDIEVISSIPIVFISSHFNYLKSIGDDSQSYVGINSYDWAIDILGINHEIDSYLNQKLDRYSLKDYCNNLNNSDLNTKIAILSWGGMRRNHGRLLFKNTTHLNQLINDLRNKKYSSRKAAFEAFQQIRSEGKLPGLGIGYFTKLICFLAPELNGYIMDQWAGKSVNLLIGEKIVTINSVGWVTDDNDSGVYERYCKIIDELGLQMNCTGFEAEKRIFSVGNGRGQWRKYLMANYSKQFPD